VLIALPGVRSGSVVDDDLATAPVQFPTGSATPVIRSTDVAYRRRWSSS
jgi:hypothetical protein